MTPWNITAEGGGIDIQDGTYLLEVTTIEETTFEDSKFGKKGPQTSVKFTFDLPDVTDEDGSVISLTATASARLTPKTKLWGWVEALTGEQLQVGQTVNVDGLVGCRALGLIATEAKEGGTKWTGIKALMPLPKEGKPKAVVSQADPWEGFREPTGDISWGDVAVYIKKEGLTPLDLAGFMGVEKAGPKQIREWIEGAPDRTFIQLVLLTREKKETSLDPEDLPFE
jgi:hypothetical protein